jgi:hypothetical protein
MVDLGFSSSWRKKTGAAADGAADGAEPRADGLPAEHIEYTQALGQFHGTTRYASLHCHAGRTLARRDDLESLAYTVLYLLQGRLPWQGQEGADKEQRDQKVLRIKGSMTPSAICATAPQQMKYLMTYVRQLPFAEEPDYEFLDHCLNFGNYGLMTGATRRRRAARAAAAVAAAAGVCLPAVCFKVGRAASEMRGGWTDGGWTDGGWTDGWVRWRQAIEAAPAGGRACVSSEAGCLPRLPASRHAGS